jgi:plastocyanin
MIRTRRPAVLLGLLAGMALVAAGCSEPNNLPEGGGQTGTPSAPVSESAALVTLEYSSFEPSIVTIKAGQSVEWMWDDAPLPHDVYFRQFIPSGGGAPLADTAHSVVQITGTWTQTFTKPGTYTYICTVHAGMTGEVIVEPAT